jgi:hypothetical protein
MNGHNQSIKVKNEQRGSNRIRIKVAAGLDGK